MFGKSLSQYLHFQRFVLMFILAVGVFRLGLSLAGLPDGQVKWVSVTVAMIVGLVYYAITVETTGFGGYKQLYPLLLIQTLVAQVFIALAIVLAILTGRDNIYTAPEYSGGGDGKTWFHAFAHLVIVPVVLPLLGWLVASAILFVTRKVARRR